MHVHDKKKERKKNGFDSDGLGQQRLATTHTNI